MKYWLINLFLFLWMSNSFGQESTLELVKRVAITADQIEVDNVGNVFLIKAGGVSKYDIEGEFIVKNSAMTYGEISTFDASNALKLVAYFRDLSQISYLDNQLGSRGRNIALDELGLNQITQVCRSYNDGLWVYDQVTFELVRLSEGLEITAQTGNLNQILDYLPEPTYMRENNNWLYVGDAQGILVFDWYGSYVKKIPVLDVSKFVVRANRLFYIQDNQVQFYHLKTYATAGIELKEDEVIDFTIFENRLLLITKNELVIYRINVK